MNQQLHQELNTDGRSREAARDLPQSYLPVGERRAWHVHSELRDLQTDSGGGLSSPEHNKFGESNRRTAAVFKRQLLVVFKNRRR